MHEVADMHKLTAIMSENEHLAGHNREYFDEVGLWTVNLMSAPGAGKTRLLESLLSAWPELRCSVVEGDMVGELDAIRLRKLGTEVFQISTGRSCHLDALMMGRLLDRESFSGKEMLFIENVGNLVCPAEFWLGEHKKVVLLSVTEGDDKPIKYPVIFRNCDAVVFTKSDLLPYVDFDIRKATEHIGILNPRAKTFSVSARNGNGIDQFKAYLQEELESYRSERGL